MTNEELAIRIKNGETELYSQLWGQTKRLITSIAYKFYNKNSTVNRRAGIEPDDLVQYGFIALCEAVKAYDSTTEYKFVTYLGFPLKNAFNMAIGRKTNRIHTLDKCVSLDEPLSDEEGSETLGDITPNEKSSKCYEEAEESLYTKELHKALEKALDSIPANNAEVLKLRYYGNITRPDTAKRLNISPEKVRQYESKGLYYLRQPRSLQELSQFRDGYIETRAYRSVGFSAWESTGSVEERIIEHLYV